MIAAVAVASVVALGTAGLVAAADVRTPTPSGAAGLFVPADGSADWVQIDPHLSRQRENARAVGASSLFELPQQALLTVWGDFPADGIQTVPLWSVLWSGEGIDPAAAPRDLYSLVGGDIALVMTTGTQTGLVYSPALRVLASDAREGSSWTSDGTAHSAVPGGDGTQGVTFDYSAQFSARAPADQAVRAFAEGHDGCLEVGAHLVFTLPGVTLSTPVTIDDVSLWCPGLGIVAATTATVGANPVRTVPASAPAPSSSGVHAQAQAWSDPEQWTAQPVAPTSTDPTFGSTPRSLDPALQPVAAGDTIVAADINTGDVSFLEPGAGALVERRIVRPGGDVTALAAVGDTVIAATSARRIVAYAPDGTRRWERAMNDVVFARPIGDGEGGILIAGVDGTLADVDAVTGAERWKTAVSADALTQIASDAGRAIVADQSGHIIAVSVTDGTQQWSVEGPVITALSAADGAVYAAGSDTSVARMDAGDGHTTWVSTAGTGVDELAIVEGVVVVLSWEDLIAFDAATGEPAWRAPGADRLVTDRTTMIVEGRGPARLLDATGATQQEWAVTPEGAAAARYLTALADQVWIFDTVSGIERIGP